LESLIRISQALAKMRLDLIVSAMDVKEAIRLMRVATQAAATDPRTGTIDMDLITTGRTALDRDLVLRLMEIIRKFLENKTGQRMTYGQIRQALLQDEETNLRQGGNDLSGIGMTVSMGEVEEALRELETDGVVQIIDRTQMVIVR
jgi:DNA replication licensing factor MCM4